MRVVLLFLLFSFISLNAKEVTVSLKTAKLNFKLPAEWKDEGAVMAADKIFTHIHQQERDLFAIYAVPKFRMKFTGSLKQEANVYKQIKKKWAAKRKIEILKFLPAKSNVVDGNSYYEFGMIYKVGNKILTEKSLYLFCNYHPLLLKFLGYDQNNFITTSSTMVWESLRCL